MKKSTVILIWGAGTGIVTTIYFQILNATGQENSGLKYVSMLILFLGLFMGTRQVRDKANGGYLSFGECFKAGFLMVLLITLIGIISTIVDLQMHPEMIDKILDQSRDNMVNKGMTEQQIEIGMHYTKMFTTPTWIVIWVVIFDLLFGSIFSLIVAGISSKKKPMFDNANETSGNNVPQS